MSAVRKRLRILVIDDETSIRRFLRISLSSQGYDMIEATDAASGLDQLQRAQPDLVVLDLGLPGADGRSVLNAIRQQSATLPVIILSVRADEGVKVDALDAGANDYVTKPFGLPELLARIRRLLRSPVPDQAAVGPFDDGHLHIDPAAHRVTMNGKPLHLTRKEYGVLRILVGQAGRVVTQRHLLQEVWGPTHADRTHYLRIIVGRLRQKLGDDPTEPTYIQTEAGVGYRFTSRHAFPGDDASG